ncbi:MAG: type II toxin-antitoxin system Phd/YefM family antitoxin [Mariprofundus sp.]
MIQVSVRELKNHLSEYLHRVEQGEDIQVARRNVPVARLTPIPRATLTSMSGTSWSGIKAKGGRIRPAISGKSAADRVLEDRG